MGQPSATSSTSLTSSYTPRTSKTATDTWGSHRQMAIKRRQFGCQPQPNTVRQVLKSQLNGKNKIQVINTYAQPVIRYPAGIMSWSLQEVQATDDKTRRLLIMQGGFHSKSSILRLYAKQREGGQGLVGIRATIQEETAGLQDYINKMVPLMTC